jgi:sec-independent protein translocase protein TatA
MGINLGEAFLITAIVTLCFGGKKIPELGKTLGASIKGFKQGMKEEAPADTTAENDDKTKKT